MWWLVILRVKKPRKNQNERGAITVLTAVCLVALLFVVALVVNVGISYAEKSQLQNGADAAALAVANKCAERATTTPCQAGTIPADLQVLANSLVDSNSNDGSSSVLLEMGTGVVTATTSTVSSDGAKIILPISGVNATVRAVAAASWGGPSGGPAAFPITFSDCQFNLSGAVQLLQIHMTDAAHECGRGPSGLIIPGGFGWLNQDPGQCQATINLNAGGGMVGGDTGNNAPKNCDAVLNGWIAKINAGKQVIVLLPVYDGATGNGANTIFHIRGFAAFQVLGWRFPGSSPNSFNNTGNSPSSLNCSGNCSGIIGKFIEFTTVDSAFPPGGQDLGAHVIGLTR